MAPALSLNQGVTTSRAINHLLQVMPSEIRRDLPWSETEPETDEEQIQVVHNQLVHLLVSFLSTSSFINNRNRSLLMLLKRTRYVSHSIYHYITSVLTKKCLLTEERRRGDGQLV